MKKLISLLLAVSVMAMSAVASAESLKAGGQRNPGSAANNSGNSDFLRDYKNVPYQLAVYRPGDTISFTEEKSEQIANGDVITFISSKVDAVDYTDATVMFIDQVTAESDSPSYSYKIREDLAEGIYKLEIKIGSNDVKTFYYAVGAPKVDVLYTNEAETLQYLHDEVGQRAQYFAVASIGTKDVTYNQIGVARFGFDSKSVEATTFEASVFDNAMAANELDSAEFVFTIQINDVPSTDDLPPVVDGIIVDE